VRASVSESRLGSGAGKWGQGALGGEQGGGPAVRVF
jgi:hypothetical protein